MSWSIERKTQAAFIGVAVFVLLTGFLAYQNAASFISANDLVGHSRDVRREVTGAQTALVNIQSAHEGYLLTKDESYIAPYQAAVTRLGQRQQNLRDLTTDNPNQSARLDRLDAPIAQWLALVDESFQLQQNGQDAAARSFFSKSDGKTLLDQIIGILTDMNNEENQLLQDRTAESAQRAQFTLVTFLLLTAVLIGLMAYVYYLIRRDLARRKDYERILRGERTLLRTVIDTVPDMIYVKDSALHFLMINRAQADLIGVTAPEDATGKGDTDYFPAEMARGFVADEQAILTTKQPLLNREEAVRRVDGQIRVMLTTKVPVQGSSGEVIQIVGISHDITERKQAEQEIEHLNQDLSARTVELEGKNKELEAFSYTVSHDLRAPVRAINGFSRILVEEHGSEISEEAMRYLQKVRTNADRMGEMIDDLLHFSRVSRQALSKKIIQPTELVRQILDEDLHDEQENRTIEIEVKAMPPVEADPLLLRQAYVNLLSNAIKFTEKRDGARIEVGAERENGEVVYFVKDNGAGFDAKYKQKLFGVFQRLHRAEDFNGTGVGLAIVHRIVTRHGGRVWADGAVNEGATFYFTLGENIGEPNGGNSSG